ncbi:glycosyltransferase family 25 protein [Bradyrhizobium sp. NP1]|uniref:glycosyltransferase family 25 protein n=1 Tax=Bradyrhizobium sp. NP1 TaxID=3049772 RepID=UPI0025A5D8DF|nr:glycosyltransferase family 25 protein [Bradyrhizobium sp. NP1]WJR81418.1 glycosyltransferase family 25 protein [Bradyrhizobium sp. NP1]
MKTIEVVVISLPKATERRCRIAAMFDGTGIRWRYFDAHDSLQHAGLQYDPDEVRRRFGRTLSGPEVAICSSHVAVLDQHLKYGTSDYVLVLEDDVIYDTDFPIEKFGTVCAEKGLDYIRLFGKHHAESIPLTFFFDRQIVRFKTSPTGAQAYLMSKTGARLFLESFRSIDQPVDLALDSFWRTRLPIYSIFPFPIIERYSRSQNLIPPYPARRDPREQLDWLCTRVANKTKKIWANVKLTSTDRQMQKAGAKFQQIVDE